MDTVLDVFDIPGSEIQAAMVNVEETKDIYEQTVTIKAVPGGKQGDKYVSWGDDDDLPNKIFNLIGTDEVCSQNMFFNTKACYGAGIQVVDKKTGEVNTDEEIDDWCFRQSLPNYFIGQCTDMKYYFFSVVVIILNKEGTFINKIRRKEACYCRFAPIKNGVIPYVYYGDWGNKNLKNVECIPLLDTYDPLGDLEVRLGKVPNDKGLYENTKDRKFAILVKYPTAKNSYYPEPYYSAVFRGGAYDEKRLISIAKKAKLKNHTSIKYIVEVERGYWGRACDAAGANTAEEKKAFIQKKKEEFRDFIAGVENSGKVWITGFYVGPDGKEVPDVKVIKIDANKEGGDWGEDVNISSNTMCYAFGLHPNLVGAVPGKSQTNNSGSDKRELFTMQQATETSFHDLLLQPLKVVFRFNKWNNVIPKQSMILLTTLDKHTDAKKI